MSSSPTSSRNFARAAEMDPYQDEYYPTGQFTPTNFLSSSQDRQSFSSSTISRHTPVSTSAQSTNFYSRTTQNDGHLSSAEPLDPQLVRPMDFEYASIPQGANFSTPIPTINPSQISAAQNDSTSLTFEDDQSSAPLSTISSAVTTAIPTSASVPQSTTDRAYKTTAKHRETSKQAHKRANDRELEGARLLHEMIPEQFRMQGDIKRGAAKEKIRAFAESITYIPYLQGVMVDQARKIREDQATIATLRAALAAKDQELEPEPEPVTEGPVSLTKEQ